VPAGERSGAGEFRLGRGAVIGLVILWLAMFEFLVRSLDIRNDQYYRISAARQILTFGELPFRDFLDPGYFLTEFSSAGVQWLFGENVVGELLLNAVFVATGCLCVCVLARRLAGRWLPALLAGLFALIALPRAYDYDKALFYPLGLLLIVRWLERPSPRRAAALAVTLVIAALYRYDNGVFLGLAALVGAIVACGRDWRRLANLALPAVVLAGTLCAPVLLFLQLHGGIGDAADQALTYGVREGARTRITSLPRLRGATSLIAVAPPPPSENHVRVRWVTGASTPPQRRELAQRLGLADEMPHASSDGRTWSYTLPDASLMRIRTLVNAPEVEDTDGIDRGQLRLLAPEPRLLVLQRMSPLFRIRLLPGAWTFENTEAFLYYLLMLVPFAGTVLLVSRRSWLSPVVRGELAAVITLCVLLCAFILRDPVSARVGGIAGPFCVLAAWLLTSVTRQSGRIGTLVTGLVLVSVSVGLSIAVGWHRQVSVPFVHPGEFIERLRAFAQEPPPSTLLPSGRVRGIVDYVHACTLPQDRVFTTWFVPELYYFAQRGFGGATALTFGGHWSEPRFQQRIIAALNAHPTPLMIATRGTYAPFRVDYPQVARYFADHYALAASTDFGDQEAAADGYQVFVRRDRKPARIDGPFGLPCFANASPRDGAR
jgi:hypothetical protein